MNKIKIKLFSLVSKNNLVQLFVVIGLFFVAFIANKIPHNFFIAGGDFYQVLNPAAHFSRYLYAWLNQTGQGIFNSLFVAFPFYGILSVLDYIGLNSATITSFQMFFVLYFSYLSFYFSIKAIFPGLKNNIRLGGSLLYALNNFTLTFFLYSWGFTHHVLFYIFIPLLISFFIKIFLEEKFVLKDLIIFILFFLFSIVGYNNIAFFVALLLIQSFVFSFLLLSRKINFGKILIKKIIILSFVYLFIAAYLLFPFYLANLDYTASATNSAAIGGSTLGIVKDSSNSILNILPYSEGIY